MKRLINLTTASCLLLLAIMWSCAKETESPKEPPSPPAQTTLIGLEQALENADALMAEFDPSTRSTARKVESVKAVPSPASTRSTSTDTLLYVVNYANDEGFALLGTDMRMPTAYAISPTGHLELADTVHDPMFSIFINSAIEDAAEKLNSPVGMSDVVIGGWTTVAEYRNKKEAIVDLPEALANLKIEDTESLHGGNCSDMALSLTKALYTIITFHGYNSPDGYLYGKYNTLKDTQNEKEAQNAAKNAVQYVDDGINRNGFLSYLRHDLHILIWGEDYYDANTGCGCKSYWTMHAIYHNDQIFNLLTGKSPVAEQAIIMVPFAGQPLESQPSFVVNKYRTHDKYVRRKFDYAIIEGPTPERWMHCLWSEAKSSNGYYLYSGDTITVNEGEGSEKILKKLLILSGFEQDATSGK